MEAEKRIMLLQAQAKHTPNKTQPYTMLLLNQLHTLKVVNIHQAALANQAMLPIQPWTTPPLWAAISVECHKIICRWTRQVLSSSMRIMIETSWQVQINKLVEVVKETDHLSWIKLGTERTFHTKCIEKQIAISTSYHLWTNKLLVVQANDSTTEHNY